jgi:hypothetical protein
MGDSAVALRYTGSTQLDPEIGRKLMRLFRICAALFAATIIIVPAATALAQGPSIAGTWTLNATVTPEGEEAACFFEGSTTLTQDGSTVSGPATLSLVSGPESCPGELSGTLNGTVGVSKVGDTTVNGTITGGSPAGEASFTGTFSPVLAGIASPRSLVAMALAFQASSGSGSISVGSGPFAGAGGTWMASAPAAPAFNPLGLLILVALLLIAGYIALRRQEAQRPA